jgi:hypothetical protein
MKKRPNIGLQPTGVKRNEWYGESVKITLGIGSTVLFALLSRAE